MSGARGEITSQLRPLGNWGLHGRQTDDLSCPSSSRPYPRLPRSCPFRLRTNTSGLCDRWCAQSLHAILFSSDALADLVLAVDEAASLLVSHACSASTVVCVFDSIPAPGSLRVHLTSTTDAPIDVLTSLFGWFVLDTLVDNATLDQKPGGTAVDDLSVTSSVGKALRPAA